MTYLLAKVIWAALHAAAATAVITQRKGWFR